MSRTPDGNGSLEIHPSPTCAESTGPGHAVVIGGSMAGLLAARVLANHCEQVTLVERDALTDSVVTRKGIPQGRMLHVLLPRGAGIVERLFPGYARELTAAGAVSLRVPTDALVLTPAGLVGPAGHRVATAVGEPAAVRVGSSPAAAGTAGCADPRPS